MNCLEALGQKRICGKCKKLRINCVCNEHPQTGKLRSKDVSLFNQTKYNG